jgi:hypothetical protein
LREIKQPTGTHVASKDAEDEEKAYNTYMSRSPARERTMLSIAHHHQPQEYNYTFDQYQHNHNFVPQPPPRQPPYQQALYVQLPYRPMPHRVHPPTPQPIQASPQALPLYNSGPMAVSSSGHAMSVPVSAPPASQDASVAQALEIARESLDGAQDPTVSKILEQALARIWGKVQAQPDSYVMSRDEYSVFNYFQSRFHGDNTAILARRRYWNNLSA